MPALDKDNRKKLEKAVRAARKLLETGDGANKGEAIVAIELLAVHEAQPYRGMSDAQKALRRRLRFHGRQLGDTKKPDDTQEIRKLAGECAYEHWHRMLFARFLAENNMLLEPELKVPLDLATCRDLAEERGLKLWDMVGRFACQLLPAIFRPDDPVLEVPLELTKQRELEALVEGLPREVFLADDSLGWVYQFWQADEKERVNDSEMPIGANELPAVTQLFTEHYMVQFLLHNTLGAWHAAKVLAANPELAKTAKSEQELRDAVALGRPASPVPGALSTGADTGHGTRNTGHGYSWDYLRFVRESENGPWRPAAGAFAEWPRQARDLKTLDPCCGSGHFLVELFTIVLALRQHDEPQRSKLDLIREVLRHNVHGLELDPRCTQIAAFALALVAWKAAGTVLPDIHVNVACSGISVGDDREAWLKLAGKDRAARETMDALFELFRQAPLLGSLIDPARTTGEFFGKGFSAVRELVEKAVKTTADDEQREAGIAAVHVAEAMRILTDRYHLVATNVPYLARGNQSDELASYCEEKHPSAKTDLATCFVDRTFSWCQAGGTASLVTPQNWLTLTSYTKLRRDLLASRSWGMTARLGSGAFETISGAVVNVSLSVLTAATPDRDSHFAAIDAVAIPTAVEKAAQLQSGYVAVLSQRDQLLHADAVVILERQAPDPLLNTLADGVHGLGSKDTPWFFKQYWEITWPNIEWEFLQTTVSTTRPFGGMEQAVYWQKGEGILHERGRRGEAILAGAMAWGKPGVIVSQFNQLPAAIYGGHVFDKNTAVLLPRDAKHVPAVWAFCSSQDYWRSVRQIDQSMAVTNKTLAKVPFDLARWSNIAGQTFPQGLPGAQSNDPTQWLFHGHPAGMVAAGPASKSPFGVADFVGADRHPSLICREPNPADVLQVAVARLLGYCWPAELDTEMRLDAAQRDWATRSAELAQYADSDGIVCLQSLRGEDSAADRLRKLLAAAFGPHWKAGTERELLKAAGCEGEWTLEEYLRDAYFEQHLHLFHNTPFIWHIWDGRPDGFHALVNYHKLAEGNGVGRRTLESLTHTYLGEWISRQQAGKANKETGAERRLEAALVLKAELEKIIEGEPPYDIFVRWKPLHKQAIGWEPDINDGVRLNIRPFMNAKDVKQKGAGILRAKPNLKWKKDRGKEPTRDKAEFPWFWGWDEATQDFKGGSSFDGNRHNDLHYTRKAKQEARRKNPSSASGQGASK